MKCIKFISTILFILLYIPCWAQYDEFYKVDNNTCVITTPDAELYELSPYKYDLLKNRPSYFPNIRDLVDVSDCKIKRLKKSQQLRVLRYTNTSKQQDLNAYIVDYKEKIWVLYSCDVHDNTQLKARSAKMLSTQQDLENRQQALSRELDSLVAIYTQESTDSLEYYKKLKTQLPQIRDSVVNVVKTKYQYQRDSIFNNWLKNQTASVRSAAAVIRIDETRLDYPNSAGGCDYHLYFTNLSTKTIKYLRWSGLAYNRVNDPAYCEIRRTASCSGYYTGPIAPKNEGWGCWDCVVYNYTADTVKLNSITIDYTDGSHFSLSVSDIRALAKAPRTKYMCIIGSEEDRAIDAARYSLISDETCEHKIKIWEDRVDHMKYKNFWRGTWEDIYHNKQYDEIYKRLGRIKSEIAKIKSEIERFEKFIKFESY